MTEQETRELIEQLRTADVGGIAGPLMDEAADAAAYLGVSASKLRGAGIPHKVWGGNVVYDRTDRNVDIRSLSCG